MVDLNPVVNMAFGVVVYLAVGLWKMLWWLIVPCVLLTLFAPAMKRSMRRR